MDIFHIYGVSRCELRAVYFKSTHGLSVYNINFKRLEIFNL